MVRQQLTERQVSKLRRNFDEILGSLNEQLGDGIMLDRGVGEAARLNLNKLDRVARRLNDKKARCYVKVYRGYLLFRMDTGDPVSNFEKAVDEMQAAIDELYFLELSGDWAWACTSLAMVLQDPPASVGDSDYLVRATRLLYDALRVRSLENDPEDWAFTVANLVHGTILRLTSQERPSIDEMREVVRVGSSATEVLLGAGKIVQSRQTEINVEVLKHRIVQLTARERQEGYVSTNLDLLVDVLNLDVGGQRDRLIELILSMAHLAEVNPGVFGDVTTPEWAVRILALGEFGPDEGEQLLEISRRAASIAGNSGGMEVQSRAYKLAAEARAGVVGEGDPEVRNLYQLSFETISERYDPDYFVELGQLLGLSWAKQENWQAARDVLQRTYEAVDEIYLRNETIGGRDEALARYPKLLENLAFALTRCGQPTEAVRVLEFGRARDLSRAILDKEGVYAGKNLRAEEEIARASTRQRPIIYVISTISGSVSVAISPGRDNLAAEIVGESNVTSGELVQFQYNLDPGLGRASGIMSRNDDTLERTLSAQSNSLGLAFGANIARYLQELNCDSVVIVPVGMLGVAPIAGAKVRDDERLGCERLIDVAAVATVPSASCLVGLRYRSERSPWRPSRYCGIANTDPTEGSLPNTEAEVMYAAACYQEPVAAVGQDATLDFLVREHSGCDELHFACHGVADQNDARRSFIVLADGSLTVETVGQNLDLDGALVTLSACESGQYGVWRLDANQQIGLAAAFLAAGASCVVTSLAQIDDFASFALITKFHQRLSAYVGAPDQMARALRDAQLWLRGANRLEVLTDVDAALGRAASRGALDWFAGLRRRERVRDSHKFELRHWVQFSCVGC